jgi:hypothetical protein
MLAGKAIKHFDDVTDTDFQAVYLRLMEREDIGEESEGTPEEESEEKPDPKPYEEYRKDVRGKRATPSFLPVLITLYRHAGQCCGRLCKGATV